MIMDRFGKSTLAVTVRDTNYKFLVHHNVEVTYLLRKMSRLIFLTVQQLVGPKYWRLRTLGESFSMS